MTQNTGVPIPGSHRDPLPGARVDAPTDPGERLTVTVYLRPSPHASQKVDVAAQAGLLPRERHYLDPAEVQAQFGADPAEMSAVADWARGCGLEVVRQNVAARSLRLAGTAADFSHAFGVQLQTWRHAGGSYRGRTGAVNVPASLAGVVEAVLGLDNRPLGRAYLRTARGAFEAAAPGNGLPANTYLPPQVGALYQFPQSCDGTGQTVAVLVFNGQVGASGRQAPGGYDPGLLGAYFSQVIGTSPPQLTDVVVHGPGNSPGDGSSPLDVSGEVYLDLCMVGALAPGARIAVYFTEFTEQGWVDAISEAVTDAVNDPGVISVSYGNPENDPTRGLWTHAAVRQVDRALEAAAAAGRTVCCAAGDDGSADEPGTTAVHADFPASSPWVLACGGTRLESSNGTITREVVWNDLADGNGATGGGTSTVFRLPAWQQAAGVPTACDMPSPGRGVPDVASLADPQTPFVVVGPNGSLAGVGGTSAAAPLWAALAARLSEALGTRVGYLNPLLYSRMATGVLRDITEGSNGAYQAGTGWDACTGLGVPGADALLQALQ
ncbi:MAG TPA: S53 family peptidase [Streptosporangiaceae bacterium]|nr:S53 family peptidase [Streptosporangiaceae bacterium]